jgi:hypothetical protein
MGCIDPRFLDVGTSWRWVVSFIPRPLYPRGKSPSPPYPFDRRLGRPHHRYGRQGEERILASTGTQTPTARSSSPKPIAIPSVLPQPPTTFLYLTPCRLVGKHPQFRKNPLLLYSASSPEDRSCRLIWNTDIFLPDCTVSYQVRH